MAVCHRMLVLCVTLVNDIGYENMLGVLGEEVEVENVEITMVVLALN